jgi:hypothetical protein
MKIISIVAAFIAAASAAPDPLITPRAQLAPRQDDPALLGWVDATNGQCTSIHIFFPHHQSNIIFHPDSTIILPSQINVLTPPPTTVSDSRTCDYPATLSSSGSLAQCCASASPCIFWSSCSAGTLFASQTSLFCDQGYCNTAVLVPTAGASIGQSYLGCWATSLGQEPFTLVRDIGAGSVVAGSEVSSVVSAASSARSSLSSAVSAASSRASSAGASATQSSAGPATSSGVAAVANVGPFTGVLGLVAVFFGML